MNGVAFRFSGVVQWSDGHTQLGIRFVNMIPRRKAELAEVIEEMAARVQPVNQFGRGTGRSGNFSAEDPQSGCSQAGRADCGESE